MTPPTRQTTHDGFELQFGTTPTNLLAARPELGRTRDTTLVRLIRALSSRGIVFGRVETALLPALYAATSPEARGAHLYGAQRIPPPFRSTRGTEAVLAAT